jgi:GDSL-like lipase/acylhydrolase family protein
VSERSARLLVAALAGVAALAVAAAGVEVWVRTTWDVRRGTPDFYVPDAVRGQRLSENYSGWFAGVPVHINSLGLRDPREYDLAKKPATFRILVLGDSVTFGHGSVYEHSYPYLVEQQLKAWRPDIDWQVWNAAVPGYNTSQELAQLLEVGPRFNPDLVVVGFYENDLTDNGPIPQPTRVRRLATAVEGFARHHLWSLEFYRRVYYTVVWRVRSPDAYRERLRMLARSDASAPPDASRLKEQDLTPYDRLSDAELSDTRCAPVECVGEDVLDAVRKDPGYAPWLASVRALQALHRQGRYRIVFFLNNVPRNASNADRFFDGTTRVLNQFMLRTLGDGTPAVSCHDAFLHVRPSQMPGAEGHSIGNANRIKADVLFEYLRDRVLPEALPAALRARAPS